jgi:hypothetical protein
MVRVEYIKIEDTIGGLMKSTEESWFDTIEHALHWQTTTNLNKKSLFTVANLIKTGYVKGGMDKVREFELDEA